MGVKPYFPPGAAVQFAEYAVKCVLQPLQDVGFALPKKKKMRESLKSALTFTDLILTALISATPALLCTAGQAPVLHELFPRTQYLTDGQTAYGPPVLSAFFGRGKNATSL